MYKTGGTQLQLGAACFVVQSCLADADCVVFSNYCLIGTRLNAPAFELVKKVFLTSSQTRPTALGSRLKRLRLAAAHSLTFARLRAVKYFLRRTRRRRKHFRLYLRLRAQTLRGFFMEKSPFRRGEAAAEGISFDEALPLPEASLGGESFISNASPYRRARRPSGGRGSRPYRCSPSFHKSQAPPWWG